METKTILQIAALGAVAFGAYTVAKITFNKVKEKTGGEEEKSNYVGRLARGNMYMKPKRKASRNRPVRKIFKGGKEPIVTQKLGCLCANNNPSKGGYFGDCPCKKGYWDIEEGMASSNFDSGEITTNYMTPRWTVGG